MGSAVVKPLTRRRGKIKKNKVGVDPVNGNEEENATSNCEPGVNCEVNIFSDSAKNLQQSFPGKPCTVKINNARSKHNVCCTYGFFNGRHNSSDSDEELCQKQQTRKKKLGPSQIIKSLYNGTHLLQHSKKHFPSQTLTSTDALSPSQVPKPDRCTHITQVSSELNAVIFPEVCSSQKCVVDKENEQDIEQDSQPENTIVISLKEFMKDLNLEDEDVSRICPPSPEHDNSEKVQAINVKSWSTELSSALPPSEDLTHSSETKIFPSRVYFGEPIRSAEQRENRREQVAFINTPSQEYDVDRLGGSGEPSFGKVNCTQYDHFIKPGMKPPLCGHLDCGKDDDSNADNRCPSLRDLSPKSESNKSIKSPKIMIKVQEDVSLECNENNAIHSMDSLEDFLRGPLLRPGNNSCSSSLLDSRGNVFKSGKGNLLPKRPHVEEVLAAGEEFVDEIIQRYYPQSSVHSPRPKTGKHLKPILEDEGNENASHLARKKDRNIGDEGSVKSPRSSLCSSRVRESSLDQQRSRPASGAETSARQCSSLLDPNNSYHGKAVSPSPGANNSQTCLDVVPSGANNSQTCHDVVPSYMFPIGGQIIKKGQPQSKAISVDDSMLKDDRLSPRTCLSKESLQSKGTIHVQPKAHTQTHNCSRRASQPCLDVVTISGVSNKCNSRPPSSKPSSSSLAISEQTRARTRPILREQAACTSDSLQLNARPPSVHSRHSSNTSRPSSGLRRSSPHSRHSSNTSRPSSGLRRSSPHSRLEVAGDGADPGKSGLTRSHTISSNFSGSELNAACDELLRSLRSTDSVGSNLPRTSQTPVAVLSTLKRTARSPPNTCFSKGSLSHLKIETPFEAGEGTSSLDHCCHLDEYTQSNNAIKSSSRSPASSRKSIFGEHEELNLENVTVPKEKVHQSVVAEFSRVDVLTKEASSCLTRTNEEPGPSGQAPPCCLSPEKIDNIRKQLYEEGLKPAERDGGVAFFIPITEDGLLPQIDGVGVAERITKTKKASLNYEERMFLASINRQIQLSKKKEFAIRDIRNVKGATSSSDGSDITKQNDDLDEFDVPF